MNVRPIDANALLQQECCGRISGIEVRNAPTLDYVPRQQWISVKDRLPEDPRFVLVYVKHPSAHPFPAWSCIMTDMYLGDRWMENADEEVHEVTHWMPLPEAPKEE